MQKLTCPHNDCGKKFTKFIMLTDPTKIPRETYYACPHCKSKVDIITDSKTLFFSSPWRKTKEKPSYGCQYHFGYLKLYFKGSPVPETCLTCPQLTECMAKEVL